MRMKRTTARSIRSGKMGSKPTALLNAALDYRERGWSVIPVEPEGKKPLIEWKRYQTQRATKTEIREWFRQEANIGIVTGRVSGLVVLDIDPAKGGDASLAALGLFPQTLKVATGGGGRHIYFAYPVGTEIPSSAGKLGPGLDVRGDGGYVVAPPSVHASGKRYKWSDSSGLTPLPARLLELMTDPFKAMGDEQEVLAGRRNMHLTSFAGTMRRRGMGEDAIASALLVENKARCKPPLQDEEVRRIASSVARYEAGATEADEHLTDLGNAHRLVRQHGENLRYCPAWGTWLVWDGKRWAKDQTGEVERRAKQTVQDLYLAAATNEGLDGRQRLAKHALASEARARIEAMVRLAETERDIAVTPDQLDADPWLLNVSNGTLDLRTGQLRPHDRNALITKLAPVEYESTAECPEFQRFLEKITGSDEELARFLQVTIGYSLTGDTREQCLFLLYGTGANGKSTFLGTINALLGVNGGYALTTRSETLMRKRDGSIPNDLAALHGARFVTAIEAEDGHRLAESLVKSMTGGDLISARFLYGEFFTFAPTFKVFIAANHKPVITGTDHAMWRRIRLVPFTVTIPEAEQDKTLPDKLRAELPGILRWAVEGCRRWQSGGLVAPRAVRVATESYKNEMDTLGNFLDEYCVIDPKGRVAASDLYDAYSEWCEEAGVRYPLTKTQFGVRLKERGFRPKKSGSERFWRGLELRDEDEADRAA